MLGVPVADGGEAGARLLGNESLTSLFGVDVVVASNAVVVAGVEFLRGKGAGADGGAAGLGSGRRGRTPFESRLRRVRQQ